MVDIRINDTWEIRESLYRVQRMDDNNIQCTNFCTGEAVEIPRIEFEKAEIAGRSEFEPGELVDWLES